MHCLHRGKEETLCCSGGATTNEVEEATARKWDRDVEASGNEFLLRDSETDGGEIRLGGLARCSIAHRGQAVGPPRRSRCATG